MSQGHQDRAPMGCFLFWLGLLGAPIGAAVGFLIGLAISRTNSPGAGFGALQQGLCILTTTCVMGACCGLYIGFQVALTIHDRRKRREP